MNKSIKAIRGFNDVLPPVSHAWAFFEQHIRALADLYGYQEMRLPLLEKTELFIRGVGTVTDIVEKEIYAFDDRNGESLALRPEGTAGCVRAALEHGLLHNQMPRLWYMGPMFRHERPQAGRYRQFYQVGFEAFGMSDASLDSELLLMTAALWRRLGLLPHLTLQINSLGSIEARQQYRTLLVAYFEQHHAMLDEESVRRLHKNPLRILDSKNPALAALIAAAPKLLDHLDAASLQHFTELQHLLTAAGIAFEINPCLVRGLDYYGRTVFEWVSSDLGSQGTVCAGGRYDALVEELGGKPSAACGFAMGIERLLLLLEQKDLLPPVKPVDVYIISVETAAKVPALLLAELLRSQLKLNVQCDCTDASLKSQFKRADKSGAAWAIIFGDEELKTATMSVKALRGDTPQQQLTEAECLQFLGQHS